jgi:hypothetical protein
MHACTSEIPAAMARNSAPCPKEDIAAEVFDLINALLGTRLRHIAFEIRHPICPYRACCLEFLDSPKEIAPVVSDWSSSCSPIEEVACRGSLERLLECKPSQFREGGFRIRKGKSFLFRDHHWGGERE